MKEFTRAYPLFALCGLNCGLCPRYQSKGASRCPGCGGADFSLKHPTCAVITCNKKHDNVEFCYQCSAYPCDRYTIIGSKDSFVSYQNVVIDFEKARVGGIEAYQLELNEKIRILEFLIENYNDGKKMSFYCNAVNLLSLADIQSILKDTFDKISAIDMTQKEKMQLITEAFEEKAKACGIDLKLRK